MPVQIQSVGIGSTEQANALNRLYSNPVTAQLATQQSSLRTISQIRSPLSSSRYSSQFIAGRYQTAPLSALTQAGSGIQSPTSPALSLSSTAAQFQAKYGASLSATGGGLSILATGYISQAPVAAQVQARNEWLKTTDGRAYAALQRAYLTEYGFPQSGDSITGVPSDQNLQDFARLKAREAYNNKLQEAIDAYQAKPENRRALYDRMVGNGEIQAPEGYKSEALDRYRKQYGDEKTVNDIKPYGDLTPNYGDLKPDIVFHPDGTVSYEKPDPNSSNIPLVLAPSQPINKPIDLSRYETVITGMVDINDYHWPDLHFSSDNQVYSESIYRETNGYYPSGYSDNIGIIHPDGTKQLLNIAIKPGWSVSSQPIPGLPPPENEPDPVSPVPQPIPTNPDGSADLKPFVPPVESPISSLSPSRASNLLPMGLPNNSSLGNLGNPEQLGQPLLDRLASAIPDGLPGLFPTNQTAPNSPVLSPAAPSSGVGERNPVRAISLNSTPTTTPTTTPTKTPVQSVPTTSNPTKIDNTVAKQTSEQLSTKPKADTTTKPRQCEDPCVQGLHEKADESAKKVEITVKVFKSCKVNANSNISTTSKDNSDDVEFENKKIKVLASEVETYKLMYERIFTLESAQCNATAVASIPEWWAVKVGADRPQLVVLFAEILPSGKLSSSRWSLSIPHYNKPQAYRPSIPSYTKGNFRATLTLTDNSKLVVNGETKMEAQKVINRLKILIPVQYRTKNGKAIKTQITEDADGNFKKTKVVPVRADFYPKGKENMQPNWTIKLRAKK